MLNSIRFVIVITSDRASAGSCQDKTSPLLETIIIQNHGILVDKFIVPDETDTIRTKLMSMALRSDIDVILTSGGTGISARDVTVDVTLDIIEKEIPGFGEEMRRRSQEVTPNGILSRATAGVLCNTFILNLPGSPKGAEECLNWVLIPLAHAVKILKKEIIDCQAEWNSGRKNS